MGESSDAFLGISLARKALGSQFFFLGSSAIYYFSFINGDIDSETGVGTFLILAYLTSTP